MNKILFTILILLGACKTSEVSNDDFIGQWRYQNSQDEYAEIWFDASYILLLDETSYNIDIYNYSVSKDSIMMYSLNGRKLVYSFNYKSLSLNEVVLINDFVNVTIKKFGELRSIDTSSIFKEQVYKEFKERLLLH